MTERSIPKNLQEELKLIWGDDGYTKRMLFGPPLPQEEVINHNSTPSRETNKPLSFNSDKNESSYFTPSQQLTSRILKRRSQPPK